MATDPVQQIQEMEHDTPLAMDLTATLARLPRYRHRPRRRT